MHWVVEGLSLNLTSMNMQRYKYEQRMQHSKSSTSLPIASAERTEGSKLLVVARYTCRFEIFCHFLFSQPKSLKSVVRVQKKSQLTSL